MEAAYLKSKVSRPSHAQTKSVTVEIVGKKRISTEEAEKINVYFRYLPVSVLGASGYK